MNRAIVTGTSSGIGCAIAEHLLAQGWHVVGLDRTMPTIESANFQHVGVDLEDQISLVETVRPFARVDAFVHAAGVLRVAPLGALDTASGQQMWRIHVDAACTLANEIVPGMTQRKAGRVVLIGSRVAAGKAGRSQYAATKAALIGLARSWASEVVAHGVTVNVVSPAATQTAMLSDPTRAASAPRVPPIGRYILPQEIAALVYFLLSPAAAAITGQDIAVCGGASLPG